MDDLLRSFPTLLKFLGAEAAAVEQLVFVAWRRSVDGALAKNVVPVRWDGTRLFAAVPNETWRRQLSDLGPAMANRLNAALGGRFVSYVEFRVDPAAVRSARTIVEETEKMRSVAPKSEDLPEELLNASLAIADEPLRQLFLAAAGGSLARNARLR